MKNILYSIVVLMVVFFHTVLPMRHSEGFRVAQRVNCDASRNLPIITEQLIAGIRSQNPNPPLQPSKVLVIKTQSPNQPRKLKRRNKVK